MNRFLFVSPRNSSEEVIEAAVLLIEQDYNQMPDTNKEGTHLFIDNKNKHFWFTDEKGLGHTIEVTEAMFDSQTTETNLKQISQWQRKQKIKA